LPHPLRRGVEDPMRTMELANDEGRMWIAMTGLSIFCHLLAVVAITLLPQLHLPQEKIPPVIRVDLVSLPAPPPVKGPPGQSKAAKATPPAVKKEPVPKKEPPKAIEKAKPHEKVHEKPPVPVKKEKPEPVKIKAKEPLKAKASKPVPKEKEPAPSEDSVKNAIARMRKEVGDDRPTSVSEAIERMKRELASSAASRGAGEGIFMAGGTGAKEGPLDKYFATLKEHVNGNWAFSERLAGGKKNLKAIVIITIDRSGAISDFMFDKRSGNTYFDESVVRAVKKSNPAPPLPDVYPDKRLTIVLGFTPPMDT